MKPTLTIAALRRRALSASLIAPTTLARAIRTLGFVQADPIRAPARAQDLILRHRVAGYRAGDLERRFASLAVEEDYLYAYGFLPRDAAHWLYPRHDPEAPDGRHVPSGLAAEVLEFVAARGATHPQDLEATFGRDRTLNGWGQASKATTRALHVLQHHGLLRVARRTNGIRIYEVAASRPEPLAPDERARRIVRLVVRLLAPVSSPAMAFRQLVRGAPGLGPSAAVVKDLLEAGELETGTVDGERYIWPAGGRSADEPPQVRLLAPFDPIVWDRRRFAHLWGWEYRFEAYTKQHRRRFGYYALPLLWGDRVIGWANLTTPGGRLDVGLGFVAKAPKGRDFARALDAEIARIEAFLAPPG